MYKIESTSDIKEPGKMTAKRYFSLLINSHQLIESHYATKFGKSSTENKSK